MLIIFLVFEKFHHDHTFPLFDTISGGDFLLQADNKASSESIQTRPLPTRYGPLNYVIAEPTLLCIHREVNFQK